MESFQEFARQKLLQHRNSPMKTFLVLDEDRDGLITPSDIASFLSRFSIKSSFLSIQEISSWFSKVCDSPQNGISLSQFARFLQFNESSSFYPKMINQKISSQLISQLQQCLIQYQARLAVDFNGLYHALTGGKGFLYEHQLRRFFECEFELKFGDLDWKRIMKIIKWNANVQQVSKEELYDFLTGKVISQQFNNQRNVVSVDECLDQMYLQQEDEFDYEGDNEYEDEYTDDEDEEKFQPELAQEGIFKKKLVQYDTPGEKLKRTRPEGIQNRLDRIHAEEQLLKQQELDRIYEQENKRHRKSHQHCVPPPPYAEQLDKSGLQKLQCQKSQSPPKPSKKQTPRRQPTQTQDIRQTEEIYKTDSPINIKRDEMILDSLPLSADPVKKFHSTSVSATPDMLLNLISQKIQQSGAPRNVFKKFDIRHTGKLSFRVFSDQVQQNFGLVISPDQCKEFTQLLAPNAQYIDYQLFLRFYNSQAVVQQLANTKKIPSMCKQNEKIQQFMTSAYTKKQAERQQEMAEFGANGHQIDHRKAQNLAEQNLIQAQLEKGDIVRKQYPSKKEFQFQKYSDFEEPDRYNEEKVALYRENQQEFAENQQKNLKYQSFFPKDITTQRLAQSAIYREEDAKQNMTYSLTNDGSNIQNKYELKEKSEFIKKVNLMLKSRGDTIRQILRDSFTDRMELSSTDVIWFFRNKVGCSFSPAVILKTLGMMDGDFIRKPSILAAFGEDVKKR